MRGYGVSGWLTKQYIDVTKSTFTFPQRFMLTIIKCALVYEGEAITKSKQ